MPERNQIKQLSQYSGIMFIESTHEYLWQQNTHARMSKYSLVWLIKMIKLTYTSLAHHSKSPEYKVFFSGFTIFQRHMCYITTQQLLCHILLIFCKQPPKLSSIYFIWLFCVVTVAILRISHDIRQSLPHMEEREYRLRPLLLQPCGRPILSNISPAAQ